MAGLLDFAQAASNSAAGNVAGPIDMLAWGLRKMGLPIPNDPVLGTEWMKQKGLIKEVPQSPASLAGETLGLLSPIVAAAKAPQIAGGLLQMGDNLTTAKTLGSGPGGGQKGAIVYHGSPHKFDKFDSSKIGTGEGAQAYGHGLYLAESPGVAQQYQKNVTALRMPTDTFADEEIAAAKKLLTVFGSKDGEQQVKRMFGARADEILAKANSVTGSLYKVDLPDEHIARMLDWDKPLSKQAPQVQQSIKARLKDLGYSPSAAGLRAYHIEHGGFADATGETLAKKFFGDTPEAGAAFMRQQGIPGIRYLDGGSRGAGQGTANYVIFPGNEGLLTILERNGVPLR